MQTSQAQLRHSTICARAQNKLGSCILSGRRSGCIRGRNKPRSAQKFQNHATPKIIGRGCKSKVSLVMFLLFKGQARLSVEELIFRA